LPAKRISSASVHKPFSRRPRRPGAGASSDSPAPPLTGSPRTAALNLLSRRDYTTKELRDRLIDRDYPADAVDAALAGLAADRLLDDARVASAHVRTALHIKSRGRHRVMRELAARGVSRQAIDDALGQIAPGDERTAIVKVLKRKRYPAHPTLAERQKMFQQLLRRGFAPDAIRGVLGRGEWDPDADGGE
jgi:regulatory protein